MCIAASASTGPSDGGGATAPGPLMEWRGNAIVCAVSPHGETGAIVRMLTPDTGLLVGHVMAARASRNRATWLPGNTIQAQWRQRTPTQMATLSGELQRSRADLYFGSPTTGAALSWIMAALGQLLPEQLAFPDLHDGAAHLLDTMAETADVQRWTAALVQFELQLLAELGFGLDLSSCAATGTTRELVYVSPKSAQAVSRAAGLPYHAHLLALPAFLRESDGPAPVWPDIHAGLVLTGYFLARHLLVDRAAVLTGVRQFFIGRLPPPSAAA